MFFKNKKGFLEQALNIEAVKDTEREKVGILICIYIYIN